MRLSHKVILTLSIVWVSFLALSYLGTYEYLIKGILALENKEITEDINRTHQAIGQKEYALGTFVMDWAHWNDAYDYVEGTNPQFVPNNLDISAFLNSNISMLMYLNQSGKILIGVAVDLNKKEFVNFQKGLEKYIY